MNVVVDIVTPVFGIVLLGFALARAGLFNEHAGEGLTRFMFYVAIPAMLFRALATAELPAVVPWRFLLAFYGPSLLLFGAGMAVARSTLGWDRRGQGIAGMTACYSNMALLGLPLVLTALGEAATLPLFILLASQSLLLFPCATYVIEGATGGRLWLSIARLAVNPIIVSLALGVAANVAGVSPSGAAARMLETIGAAGPGCALVALGVSLGRYRVAGGLRETALLVALKNFAYPALVWAACTALEVRPDWARVAILLAAMPTGLNVFIYAHRYGIQVPATTRTIVVSTALSVVVASWLLHHFVA